MSDVPPPPPDPGALQFDRAESKGPPAAGTPCATCNQPMADLYYVLHGQKICATCSRAIQSELSSGSGAARFLKATVLGILAAALGAGIWIGIYFATKGSIFGLVAIVVGLLVGAAVRKGSEGRGGWRYQMLAIALTYVSIAAGYLPPLFEAMKSSTVEERKPEEGSAPAAPAPGGSVDAVPPAPSAGGCILAILMLLAIALATPILSGFESILSLIILAIALYEAWKLNKRVDVTITGPFRIGGAAGA